MIYTSIFELLNSMLFIPVINLGNSHKSHTLRFITLFSKIVLSWPLIIKISSTFILLISIVLSFTFNGEDRVIPLPKFISNRIQEKRSIYSVDHDSSQDFIFGISKILPAKTIENRKNKYIKMWNKNNPHNLLPPITIHGFRHSHVSLLINSNFSDYDIAERLGHSVDMVRNRYLHLFRLRKTKIVNFLDELEPK